MRQPDPLDGDSPPRWDVKLLAGFSIEQILAISKYGEAGGPKWTRGELSPSARHQKLGNSNG